MAILASVVFLGLLTVSLLWFANSIYNYVRQVDWEKKKNKGGEGA